MINDFSEIENILKKLKQMKESELKAKWITKFYNGLNTLFDK